MPATSEDVIPLHLEGQTALQIRTTLNADLRHLRSCSSLGLRDLLKDSGILYRAEFSANPDGLLVDAYPSMNAADKATAHILWDAIDGPVSTLATDTHAGGQVMQKLGQFATSVQAQLLIPLAEVVARANDLTGGRKFGQETTVGIQAIIDAYESDASRGFMELRIAHWMNELVWPEAVNGRAAVVSALRLAADNIENAVGE